MRSLKGWLRLGWLEIPCKLFSQDQTANVVPVSVKKRENIPSTRAFALHATAADAAIRASIMVI